MRRRQTIPRQWLIVAADGPDWIEDVSTLARGSGVLILFAPSPAQARRLRHLASARHLTVLREGPRRALRVHDAREVRRALSGGAPLLLLSPLHRTSTHPDWEPMPLMRAATLARLAGRRMLALGGLNARRYAKIAPLGFIGWAGISAFRT